MPSPLTLADFDYALPPELIAQQPARVRSASRLLHLDAAGGLHDRAFVELPQLLRSGDLLVFNDTRVVKARLAGVKVESGGRVEVLVERVLAGPDGAHRALAQVRASKSPRAGTRLRLADAFEVTVREREGEFFVLDFPAPVLDLLDAYGATPLPPYISHAADGSDAARYQTLYARAPGAVAAPTAGLHFDEALLAQLDALGIARAFVTLHVGAGTFQPVRVHDLAQHRMHAERYTVPPETQAAIARARAAGGRVVAVGTTSARALESAAAVTETTAETATSHKTAHKTALAPAGHASQTIAGETRLFITPGYRFRVVDALVTNFHLPQSTLLMLVSALAGAAPIRRAYAYAVSARYRFFSYGDAMLIESPTSPDAS